MLDLLPDNNIVTNRECHENIARCAVKEKLFCLSLRHCNLLHQSSKTLDHLSVSLSCLLETNLLALRLAEAYICCIRLITIHKYSSHLWARLSVILSKLFFHSCVLKSDKKFMCSPGSSSQLECKCGVDDCAAALTEEEQNLEVFLGINDCTKTLLLLFTLMMSKSILASTQGTAVGIAGEETNEKFKCVQKDISSLSENVPNSSLLAINNLVRKFVFGSSPESSVEEEFIDRGSSKYKNEHSCDVTPTAVLEMDCNRFSSYWFAKVFSIMDN